LTNVKRLKETAWYVARMPGGVRGGGREAPLYSIRPTAVPDKPGRRPPQLFHRVDMAGRAGKIILVRCILAASAGHPFFTRKAPHRHPVSLHDFLTRPIILPKLTNRSLRHQSPNGRRNGSAKTDFYGYYRRGHRLPGHIVCGKSEITRGNRISTRRQDQSDQLKVLK
jgi:hypothetical protein